MTSAAIAVLVLSELTAIPLGSVGIEQRNPLLLAACRELSVVLTASASEIKRSERPEFSATVSNKRIARCGYLTSAMDAAWIFSIPTSSWS